MSDNLEILHAGIARADITPAPGTRMMGYIGRDMAEPAGPAHDPLYVRAVWLEQGAFSIVVLACDTCFIQREEADRFKGALGRVLDIPPSRIFINSSHTHTGAAIGGRWNLHDFQMPERLHLREVENATVKAVLEARDAARPAEIHAGVTRCALPVSRRRIDDNGLARFAPAFDGPVHDAVPVCLISEAGGGAPIATLFAAACHASTVSGCAPSADYPGAACAEIDRRLGAGMAVCFQGCGGDAKARVIAESDSWRRGDWKDVEAAGRLLADAVLQCIVDGMHPVPVALRAASIEQPFPLSETPAIESLEAYVRGIPEAERRRSANATGAERLIEWVRRGNSLPQAATLTIHGLRLGAGLRFVGIEAEPVAEWGAFVEAFYGKGVTFVLGYTDGAAAYLPVTRQLPEKGYEVESWFEYGWPAPFALGIENSMRHALEALDARGID